MMVWVHRLVDLSVTLREELACLLVHGPTGSYRRVEWMEEDIDNRKWYQCGRCGKFWPGGKR